MDMHAHADTHTHTDTQPFVDIDRRCTTCAIPVPRRAANGEDVPNGSTETKQQLNSPVESSAEQWRNQICILMWMTRLPNMATWLAHHRWYRRRTCPTRPTLLCSNPTFLWIVSVCTSPGQVSRPQGKHWCNRWLIVHFQSCPIDFHRSVAKCFGAYANYGHLPLVPRASDDKCEAWTKHQDAFNGASHLHCGVSKTRSTSISFFINLSLSLSLSNLNHLSLSHSMSLQRHLLLLHSVLRGLVPECHTHMPLLWRLCRLLSKLNNISNK